MSNPFFFESEFSYEPVVKPVEQGTIEKDLAKIRQKVADAIREQIVQKGLSRGELAMAVRMTRAAVAPIARGDIAKVSTNRLLRVARSLGLKPKLTFAIDN